MDGTTIAQEVFAYLAKERIELSEDLGQRADHRAFVALRWGEEPLEDRLLP